jgi:hypothetical protein
MNTLRTLTIILNTLIIIGAGHGIGPLGLFEVVSIRELILGDFHFNIAGRYDDRLMTVGLISLMGQSTLISGFFFDRRIKSLLTIIGCLIMLTGTYILTKDSKDMNLDMFSLLFSLPFIGTSLVLLVREGLSLRQSSKRLTDNL